MIFYFVDRRFGVYDICYTYSKIPEINSSNRNKKITLYFIDIESHNLEVPLYNIYEQKMSWMKINNGRDRTVDFLVI